MTVPPHVLEKREDEAREKRVVEELVLETNSLVSRQRVAEMQATQGVIEGQVTFHLIMQICIYICICMYMFPLYLLLPW